MEHVIIVSDPWNYSNSQNEGKIYGKIIKYINDKLAIFLSNSYVEVMGHKSHYLALIPRFKEDVLTPNNINEIIRVNCCIFNCDYVDSMTEEEINNNSTFKIIGKIQRA